MDALYHALPIILNVSLSLAFLLSITSHAHKLHFFFTRLIVYLLLSISISITILLHTHTHARTLTHTHTHTLSHSHMHALSLGHIGFFPIQNLMRALSCSTMELAVLEPIHNFRFANRFITLQRKKSAQFSCQIKKLGVKYFLRMKKPRL